MLATENHPAPLTVAARVLLVDDYEPWRRLVQSVLERHKRLQIVGEARDGLEAVQAAQQLNPDLVLMDIALPNLGGIEVARQIGELTPEAKILFVSAHNDTDLVTAALRNGARGYLLKADATMDLVPAIDTVLRGQKFVSRRLM